MSTDTRNAGSEMTARRQARREHFLSHAGEVFVRLGLRHATMDDIAAQAGISKVILYRFFTSKDELISTLLDGVVARMQEHFDRPWEGLESDMRNALRVVRADTNAFLVLTRFARHDPVFGHYFETIRKANARRIGRFAEAHWAHVTDARIRAISIEAANSFSFDVVTRWIETGREEDDDLFVRWAVETLDALYATWMSGPRAR